MQRTRAALRSLAVRCGRRVQQVETAFKPHAVFRTERPTCSSPIGHSHQPVPSAIRHRSQEKRTRSTHVRPDQFLQFAQRVPASLRHHSSSEFGSKVVRSQKQRLSLVSAPTSSACATISASSLQPFQPLLSTTPSLCRIQPPTRLYLPRLPITPTHHPHPHRALLLLLLLNPVKPASLRPKLQEIQPTLKVITAQIHFACSKSRAPGRPLQTS